MALFGKILGKPAAKNVIKKPAGLAAGFLMTFFAAGLPKIFPNSATKTTFQSDYAL
ncbi:MAG: hypothetical protein OPY07_05815 [Nitrosopumilus sp.]|nr:hypothetical protein [Nitrosopumilus sp.]